MTYVSIKLSLVLILVFAFSKTTLAQEEKRGGPVRFLVPDTLDESPRNHYQGQYQGRIKLLPNLTAFTKFSHFHGTPYPYVKQSDLWFSGFEVEPGFTFHVADFMGIKIDADAMVLYQFLERNKVKGGKRAINIFEGTTPGTFDTSFIKNTCGGYELTGADTAWAFDCKDYKEWRPTIALDITFPLASWLNLEYRNRVERRIITSPDRRVEKQYRPRFKLYTQEFSSLRGLQLYAFYEGFFIEPDLYHYDYEGGIGFKPLAHLSTGLGIRWRENPADKKSEYSSHLATLYVSYFFDATSWIPQ